MKFDDALDLRAAARYLREVHGLQFTTAQLREITLAGIGPIGVVGHALTRTSELRFHPITWDRWATWARPRAVRLAYAFRHARGGKERAQLMRANLKHKG